jgi:ATP-dependent RNA helicase DbpA
MEPSSFSTFNLSAEIRKVISDTGYSRPTLIQTLSIPPLLSGRDLIGQSKTGSGKTAAFAIPLLERLDTRNRSVQVLILCPTRELCAQITREIRKLGRYQKNLRVANLTGGHPVYLQLRELREGCQVVVGTPGRIEDHLRRKSLDLSLTKVVVLDEADRMLDMGFKDHIENILNRTPKERQTAFFSATFPSTIQAMSQKFQRDVVRVTAETENEGTTPLITQIFYRSNKERKKENLRQLLAVHPPISCLIFCNQKAQVDAVWDHLNGSGFTVDRIHGDMPQMDRDRVIVKFRNQSLTCLVATDVAARGLDINGLDSVINFDLPNDPAAYVHRIGRTGRAGKSGLALSLVTDQERAKIERIQLSLGVKVTVENIPEPTHSRLPNAAPMDTLCISGGRKEKVRAGDILGAITGEAGGLRGDLVGKIEILDHQSYVAIARSHSRAALAALQRGRIKGRRFIVTLQ